MGVLLASLSYLALAGGCSPAIRPPNVIVVIADDLGWRDVGYHQSNIRTPNLDRLASEGARLERFYVQPSCTPTRAAFFTGRYPHRYGIQGVLIRPWSTAGLPLDERTLAEELRGAGYATHLVGKWHLGHAARAQLPTSRGFAHHYGSYSGAIDHYNHRRGGALDWHRDGAPLVEEGYTTDLLTDEATRIVAEHDFDEPLFLVVAFTAPHTPLQVPDEFTEAYARHPDPDRRLFAGMVTCLDRGVGRLMNAVDERGVGADTLFLFFSDNGGSRDDGADNGRLLGGKGQPNEGAVRVPAIAHWPGRIPAGLVVRSRLHVIDLYPTLAAIAGVTPGPALELDGLDVSATLFEGVAPERSELVLRVTPYDAAILRDNWKLVVRRKKGSPMERKLFDLGRRRGREETDLAGEHPEILNELLARLDALDREVVERITVPLRMPENYRVPEAWGPR